MNCSTCQRPLYNRRLKACGYCGAAIPEELRFTSEEIAELDRQATEMELKRHLREIERRVDQASVPIPVIIVT